ncbi:hypothetical protein PsYK624_102080 [Phanerochaete sordida]|uniref:Uncharacterized protein n=1 Tax=Phanerochaete sordida TaxID=48140 RepID=A0A9P3GFP8_9APHY|nr:hypothetical protein PsYK624_102080 [Phanerochaete sordida]
MIFAEHPTGQAFQGRVAPPDRAARFTVAQIGAPPALYHGDRCTHPAPHDRLRRAMSAFCVPEELLLKILAHALVLSHDAFSGPAFTNLGAGSFDLSRAHLAAAYPAPDPPLRDRAAPLRVCRRWARVGAPPLYEAAVLRTHTQLHAFAAALLRTPGLRAAVRRVRVGGGCAAHVGGVLRLAPRLHTLALGLDAPAERGFHAFPYPSAGLRGALAAVRPRRLLLERERCARGARVDEMLRLVCGAVAAWDSLERVDLSNYFTLDAALAHALRGARALRVLSLYDCAVARDLSACVRPSAVAVAAQNPRLAAVLCRGEDPAEIRAKYPGRVAELLVHDTPHAPSGLGIPRD